MIRYLKTYTHEQFYKELEFFLNIHDYEQAECQACYDFGYLEVSTSLDGSEIQPCENCNFIFHRE